MLQLKRNNCIISDSAYILIDTMPVVDLGNDTTVCENSAPLNLLVDTGYTSYYWNTGDTLNSIDINPATLGIGTTTINVEVTNGACFTNDSVNITVDELPVVNLSDTILCYDESVTFTIDTGYLYIWSTGEMSNSVTYDTTNLSTGLNTVYVIVTNGMCEVSDSVNVTFDNCTKIQDVENIEFTLYPNPAHNQITISSENLKINSIKILDITGRTIKRLLVNNEQSIIDVSDLSNGIYFIKINQNQTVKFIKE